MVSVCISLVTDDVRHPSRCLLAICGGVGLVKHLSLSFARFFLG